MSDSMGISLFTYVFLIKRTKLLRTTVAFNYISRRWRDKQQWSLKVNEIA